MNGIVYNYYGPKEQPDQYDDDWTQEEDCTNSIL